MVAVIKIQGIDQPMEFLLNRDLAPITVDNFVKLAKQGFYNGLTFHRIISGFMIQGGDPNGNGSGGSGENIKGEFSANGVNNYIEHTRGTISMARANPFDSASSQFFICHLDSRFLDGNYAAFGVMYSGYNTLDAVASTPTTNGDFPVTPVIIEYIAIKD